MQAIEAAQMKTIRYPVDGKYLGNWKEGEKIALSGRGLTWTQPDAPTTAAAATPATS